LATKNIIRAPDNETILIGKDLNPWLRSDTQIEPVGETKDFPLPEGQSFKVGSTMDEKDKVTVGRALTQNTYLFT